MRKAKTSQVEGAGKIVRGVCPDSRASRYFPFMTSKRRLLVACVAAFVGTYSLALAAAAPGPKAQLFAKFDANKNNTIDGDEIAAVRAAFAAEPKGFLARFDANQNGKLDDSEIAEMRPPGQKGGGGKKKSDADTTTKKK